MGTPLPPVLRRFAPADYPGCPITVDIAIAQGRILRAPRWGIVDLLIALLGFVVLSVPVAIAGEYLQWPLAWTVLLGTVIPLIALGGWPLFTTWLQGNGPRIDLGLRLTWRDLGWGIIGGVVALAVGGLLAAGLQVIFPELSSAAADVGEELRTEGPYPAVVAFAVCVALGAPLFEEIAFRGLGYNALAKRGLRSGWVIVITTLVFSLFHFEPLRIPILLASGAVLGILRWRTQALGASIVAHVINNLPGAAFLLLG